MAFARAAACSSLDIGLMQRATAALLEELLPGRKDTLPYSGAGNASSPQDVHDMHEWFPASAISSWRPPTKWERAELVAVAAAAVRTDDSFG
jgi:hypothetical protein